MTIGGSRSKALASKSVGGAVIAIHPVFTSVSVSVETTVVPPGDDAHVGDAWELKEYIRQEDGVLKQRRRFFVNAYRQANTHLIQTSDGSEIVGFSCTREGGYLLFLAVHPEYQGLGFGRELVGALADEHDQITCHARVSNADALAFYEGLGFEIIREIGGYYEDGGDAYYLRLGDVESLTSRLIQLFRQ